MWWPFAALAAAGGRAGWVVVSGLGRSLVFKRMEPGCRLPFRPLQMMVLQARGWRLLAA
jgi:hypothetical protein